MNLKKMAGTGLFYAFAVALLFALLTLPMHAAEAPAPGMDSYILRWSVPTQYRDGSPLAVENFYGYDIMHVQIDAQTAEACFNAALANPPNTGARSQAINGCFVSEQIGPVDWTKVTNATTIMLSGEYPIGETHAWALRPIPMDPDNPGQMLPGGSGVEKDDTWGYWSDPLFKTMQFMLRPIETLEPTIE